MMKPKRRKLTKIERALLWYEAGGKCRLCGTELPDNWHADHIVPFSVTGKTNIHEMQALCPECNLRKGSKMSLRKHQDEFCQVSDEIIGQVGHKRVKKIIADITPGGGKSAAPVILAKKLIPYRFDKIAWVVPRSSLRDQAEEAFTNPYFRKPFVLGHDNLIRQSVNDTDPSRGYAGFTTTYQAISQAPGILRQEFERYNYILFLDEPHHVAKGSILESALLPLVQRAGLLVLASGTFERNDKKEIAFLDYVRAGDFLVPDFTETDEVKIIRYPRRVALSERAILPLEFIPSDGMAEWVNKDGEVESMESFYDDDADVRSALRTVLETSFALQLIDKAVAHWEGHKRFVYPDAKLLVVSPNIRVAEVYKDHLKSSGIKCAIVHSKQDDKTVENTIKRYKKGSLDALVTVAIAYEGLDVPEITHIACLTHYRSVPWLIQCFARAVRVRDKKQRGFIFSPDDPDINKVIEALRLEQLGVAREVGPTGPGGPGPELDNRVDIVPQGSVLTTTRALAPDTKESVESAQYKLIEQAMASNGFIGLSISQFNRLAIEAGYTPLVNNNRKADIYGPLVTPSEQEKNLKESIDTYTKKVDLQYHAKEWGKTNTVIKLRFGKSRNDMTVEELQKVWRFLQSEYPLSESGYEIPSS